MDGAGHIAARSRLKAAAQQSIEKPGNTEIRMRSRVAAREARTLGVSKVRSKGANKPTPSPSKWEATSARAARRGAVNKTRRVDGESSPCGNSPHVAEHSATSRSRGQLAPSMLAKALLSKPSNSSKSKATSCRASTSATGSSAAQGSNTRRAARPSPATTSADQDSIDNRAPEDVSNGTRNSGGRDSPLSTARAVSSEFDSGIATTASGRAPRRLRLVRPAWLSSPSILCFAASSASTSLASTFMSSCARHSSLSASQRSSRAPTARDSSAPRVVNWPQMESSEAAGPSDATEGRLFRAPNAPTPPSRRRRCNNASFNKVAFQYDSGGKGLLGVRAPPRTNKCVCNKRSRPAGMAARPRPTRAGQR
mmetsp:Transcript_48674/g.141944  ORF Transcript_48674/g.141944 Transcript_48674/m.141944 type:complete len:367 (+) Transcript_48674:367-1467(+)